MNWVACLLLGVPFGNFLYAIASTGESHWYHPKVLLFFARHVPAVTWAMVALFMASSLGLLLVRRITLVFKVSAMAALLLYNIVLFKQVPVLLIALMAGLLFTPFRRPYVNSRLRWWEVAPRFEVDLDCTDVESQRRFEIINISVTGALLRNPKRADILPPYLVLEFSQSVVLRAQVVRIENEDRFGVQFLNPTKAQMRALQEVIHKNLRAKPLPQSQAA